MGLVGTTLLLTPSTTVLTRSAAAAAARRFTLCLNPGAIGVRADQRESVNLAHRHGFESVEPRADALARLNNTELKSLLDDLHAKELAWGSAGLPMNFRGEESRFQEDLQSLPATAAALQRANVTRVNTWISPGSRTLTYWQNFQLHQSRLRAVAKILKDHGLRLGLEYVGTHTSFIRSRYPFLHTLAETRDLITAIDTGNVGLVMDSWHWWQAGDTEADLLTLTNNEVVAVDLNDAPKDVDKRHQKDGERELPAATGVIDIRTFLNALAKIGYDGPVRAEPFNRPLNTLENDQACAATIRALRQAVATMSA
jgi:sugar phosphate isomerase/epimerase